MSRGFPISMLPARLPIVDFLRKTYVGLQSKILTVAASGLATLHVAGYQPLHDHLPVICAVLYPLSSANFLVLGIAFASWVPHGSGPGLSGIDRTKPVWSADRHPPRTLNHTNPGFFRHSFSRFEQEISHNLLHFRQPPALHHSSIYEEETLAGTLIPRSVTPPHTLEGPARQILADRIQETAFFPSCWPQFTHNESLLEHQRTCRTKREEVTATCEVVPLVRGGLHEACLLPHPHPSIPDKNVTAALATDNPNGYNQDWSPWVCYYFFRRASVSTYPS